MKKTLLTILAATALFYSCSDDDDNNPVDNKIEKKTIKTPSLASLVVGKNKDFTLDPSVTYTLKNAPLIVEEGGKLTIPAGTTIKCEGGKTSYLAVKMGGKIYVNGTKDKPVVMTSSKTSPAPQDWGGFIVCGRAKTNAGKNATAEVAGLTYGGDDNSDNSGVIKYLRVAYTGAIIAPKKEFNGITFYSVGNKTTINNISSLKGSDDGVEFFGGNVNVQNIYMEDADDDGLDFADGYTGKITNVYIKGVKKAGIEGSNNEADGNKTPMTTATVENVTILNNGLGMKEGAIFFKEGGGKITYKNIYVEGAKKGVHVDSDDVNAPKRIQAGDLKVNPIQFVNSTKDFVLGEQGADKVITQGNNTGAGAGAAMPTWAKGWAK